MMGGKKLPSLGNSFAGETGVPNAGRCSFPMITCSSHRSDPIHQSMAVPPTFIVVVV